MVGLILCAAVMGLVLSPIAAGVAVADIPPPTPVPPPAPVLPPDAIHLTADRLEYNSQTRLVRADGHVHAAGHDATITADHLEANLDTQDVVASGNVTLTQAAVPTTVTGSVIKLGQGPSTLRGAYLAYNFRLGTGHFEKAVGQVGFWTITGDTLDITPQQATATGASITSCDPVKPLYRITASEIIVVPNDHFTAYNASLWVGGLRVVTLPSYTMRFGEAHTGPTIGYTNLDGPYIQYANSFSVGDWRDVYRLRLGTASKFTFEDIISQRFGDHVWGAHLGRYEFYDVNGNYVAVDRYSIDLLYDRMRVPGWPLEVQVEAHGGDYAEIATGVHTAKADAVLNVATDTFRLTPSLNFSAAGRVHLDWYGTGQSRSVIEGSAALSTVLTPRSGASLSYSTVSVNGRTPFSFDNYGASSVGSLNYYYTVGGFLQAVGATLSYDFLARQTTLGATVAMNITTNVAFNLSAYYNFTTRQLTELDYAVNVRCDCATFGLLYRTFPQSPGSNSINFAVSLNAFPGTGFTVGGPGSSF